MLLVKYCLGPVDLDALPAVGADALQTQDDVEWQGARGVMHSVEDVLY